ncbi:arginine utilization regulatory protein RocR [Clostridium tepidiprofundi DSM 19306]|uniref:Arginine utilization regulatory protein RocR n=1 Tax=Clostridium tepidiprofundi DSM 19306 TaxID=1121338 RepID=A0A151B7X0_9CLOT|nr:sigma 54-interacting transcriptional regulator [Clostridium tepidiprofundi]KYH35989.1 arginine utilization regulatory protein RocR [Clostridium tepidiprofundi DSM 19306]
MNKIEKIFLCLIDNLEEGIHIVDSEGKTIYYNETMARMEGQNKENIIGKKIYEYLDGVEEESSTLMNALKSNQKIVDVLQHYSNHYKKDIVTINTTIPVNIDGNTIAALEIARDMTQLKELNERICKLEERSTSKKRNYKFSDIIGNSKVIRKAINKAMRSSLSNSSVLIYGETGSGKEVFAQSIHYNGIRKDKPFIAVNCAAIPSALLEGMFFGTVKGSYTGAENKKGIFEEANRGTLLLDEVNSLEPYLQSKLLRVLQDGYIRPLGSNKIIDVDVRVIATLNEKPEKLIEEGRLRKDFYYRLSVIRIDIPPLRERKEDIIEFVNHFIEYYNAILGKNILGIDKCVLENFYEYDWPGNIRELKNVIESAVNMADNNAVLTREYFESKLINKTYNDFNIKDESLTHYLERIEKKIIELTLSENGNNISKAARKLKISRQKLQYKIKKYDLNIE